MPYPSPPATYGVASGPPSVDYSQTPVKCSGGPYHTVGYENFITSQLASQH